MIKLPHVGKAIYLLCLIAVTNVNGQNRSQDHNSSRSNKSSSKAAPDPDAQNKSQDHNSSRSNKSGLAAPDPDVQTRAQDHNSSRSNKSGLAAPDDGWSFGMGSGASFGLKSKESSLFRGNSMATKMFGRYNFGHVGLGFNTGIIPGSISSTAVSEFLTERKFPVDALITSTKALNAYFLFGPSFSFGEKVKISADVSGGIFYNHAGGLSINQQGATRALYRFDAGSKNLMPGLSGSLSIAYPLNNSTRFFINTDYLQTTSSIRLLDPQRGIDIATEQNRSVKLFTAGVGIIKSFGGRDAASGQATGKRSAPRDPASGLATGKRMAPRDVATGQSTGKRISAPRDVATGQASGKRVLPTVNKREIAIDESGAHRILAPRDPASGLATGKRISSPRDPASGLATGKRSAMDDVENNESCGPVTLKKTNADGSTEERTFACPGDAVQYQKQTQGATFGEKVNQGLHAAGSAMSQGATFGEKVNQGLHSAGGALSQGAARNILAGKVTWSTGSSSGIVTNKTKLAGGAGGGAAAASYASTGMVINNGGGTGISTTIHARDAASGMASGKRSADAGSGMSTGRRQYEPVFFEGGNNDCTGCIASVQSQVNPYFKNNAQTGDMVPMNKSSNSAASDNSCNGISGLKVYLIDAVSGNAVATTQTEACGEFWFANIPTGDYVVKLSGGFIAKKGYDVYLKNKGSYDVAGEILAADDFFSVEIITTEGTPEEAAALIKTKTKSNQSNDRVGNTNTNNQGKASINTTRSNIKNMAVSFADTDDDGVNEIWVGDVIMDAQMDETSLLGGALPGGAVISAALRPGGPIGGIIVKGGKNPGGQMRTTNTNEYGEFEFTNWDEGNYTITADLNYVIADETFVAIGKQTQGTTFGENAKSGINGINGGMPNRISMNVTVPKQTQGATFGEKVNAGMASNIDNNQDNNTGNNPVMKWRNNNTVRSNRIDNAFVSADLDGDGNMESSYLNFNGEVATITINNNNAAGKVVEKATSGLKDVLKTQVRMAAGTLPVKWSAPEVLASRVWGDPHVDEKDGRLTLGGNNQIVQNGKWQAMPVAIKAISCNDGACAIISGSPDDFSATSRISLNGLPPGQPVTKAAVWFVDNSGTVYKGETNENGRISLNGLPPGVPVRMLMNLCADGSDDFIITFSTDAQGNAISNVLKTKHDTVKNSINNVR